MDKNTQNLLAAWYVTSQAKPVPIGKKEKSNMKCVAIILGGVLIFNLLLAIVVSIL